MGRGGQAHHGFNSLSKALGEFVERHYETPRIKAEELKARLDGGEDLVILDTRPIPEFTHISTPPGRRRPASCCSTEYSTMSSPRRHRWSSTAPGVTRAIIGAQTLINASVGNPVVALENGTSGWQSAGLEPAHGETEVLGPPTPEVLSAPAMLRPGSLSASAWPRSGLDSWPPAVESEGAPCTCWTSVRPGSSRRSLPRFASGPGGQLVQATDQYVATLGARVVLIDGRNTVRATVAASWLIQLGLSEVYVYGADAAELRVTGPDLGRERAARRGRAGQRRGGGTGPPGGCSADCDRPGRAPAVLPGAPVHPGSLYARRSTLAADPGLLAGLGQVVLTSSDGALARLTAGELASAPGSRSPRWPGGPTRGLPPAIPMRQASISSR